MIIIEICLNDLKFFKCKIKLTIGKLLNKKQQNFRFFR